jgi:hypothetical protein
VLESGGNRGEVTGEVNERAKVKVNIFGKEVQFEFFYQSGSRQPMKCIIKELQY